MAKKRNTVILLLIIAALIALGPLFTLKGAAFGGSDDAGSKAISEIIGTDYQPWIKPVMETWVGGKLPSEVESLFFSVQTGIGVGILAFFLGRFVERNKIEKERRQTNQTNQTNGTNEINQTKQTKETNEYPSL